MHAIPYYSWKFSLGSNFVSSFDRCTCSCPFTGQNFFWLVDYLEKKTHQNSKFSVCSNGIILEHCLYADSGSKSLSSFALPSGHHRSYTHPLPSQASSRAASPLLPFTLSIPRAAAAGTGASPAEPARATSPPIVMRVGSPLDL